MNKLVFHVDVNSAFLSWESVRRLENGLSDLRDIPAIIGGNPESRTSVVLAKSIPAKKYGIVTGEPVSLALRKCPSLTVCDCDFRLYSRCSKAFKDICRDYAPGVEEYSIDECFLDMSGTSIIYPDPIATAYEIKNKIRDTLGFTVNIGIGPNKVLAKMAGDFEKPDKVHTLFMDEIQAKMWPLPVGDLLYCGEASALKLNKAGIKTIGDLARSNLAYVCNILGQKLGQSLYEYSNGIDESTVNPEPEAPKGYSNETTFEEDVVSYEEANRVLMVLADSVGSRIRKDKSKAYCISVTIRGTDMKRHSHQKNLQMPTDITGEIYNEAKLLMKELWNEKVPLRLIGLSLTNLDKGEFVQMGLFSDAGRRDKEHKADEAIDAIRAKFGSDMIKRGSTMGYDGRVNRKRKAEEEEKRN